jgi:hypothetical protein
VGCTVENPAHTVAWGCSLDLDWWGSISLDATEIQPGFHHDSWAAGPFGQPRKEWLPHIDHQATRGWPICEEKLMFCSIPEPGASAGSGWLRDGLAAARGADGFARDPLFRVHGALLIACGLLRLGQERSCLIHRGCIQID